MSRSVARLITLSQVVLQGETGDDVLEGAIYSNMSHPSGYRGLSLRAAGDESWALPDLVRLFRFWESGVLRMQFRLCFEPSLHSNAVTGRRN